MTHQERVTVIFQKSVQLRGLVLDATVQIERKIDDYLSDYFGDSETKRNELKEMLWYTERITLASKKDIFCFLLKRYQSDFIDKYPNFTEKLNDIIPHRNIFAHSEIDFSISILERPDAEIVFKRYKEGKFKPKTYTKQDVIDLNKDIQEVLKYLDILIPAKPPQI